jgi:hypothetical protein
MTAMQSAVYSAPCPSCAGDADWHSSATSTGDLARTTVTYRIDCVSCGDLPAELAAPPQPSTMPLARNVWLGRTA